MTSTIVDILTGLVTVAFYTAGFIAMLYLAKWLRMEYKIAKRNYSKPYYTFEKLEYSCSSKENKNRK